MGSTGTRFGRNVPLDRAFPEAERDLLEPSPRLVSRRLLRQGALHPGRGGQPPGRGVDPVRGARLDEPRHGSVQADLHRAREGRRRLARANDEGPEQRGRPEAAVDGMPPVYPTKDTHWWDGSQIYGNDEAFQELARTRTDGKLHIGDDGLHPATLDPLLDPVGPRGNFWVGLGLLHALFIREHNAICDALRREHGDWSDDQLYDKARLDHRGRDGKDPHGRVDAGDHRPPDDRTGHARELVRRRGRARSQEVRAPRPERRPERHPRLADRSSRGSLLADGGVRLRLPHAPAHSRRIRVHPARRCGPHPRRVRRDRAGTVATAARRDRSRRRASTHSRSANPGALVLHNYPTSFIRDFRPDPDGPPVDLATVDILRDRERGVPRYNEFRTLMHRKPVASFEELASDPEVAAQLQDVYGHVDRVDLMVGLYAERRPRASPSATRRSACSS